MSSGTAEILAGFADPPPGYGPVPFWWWVGETLDVDRLCWQLDRLREKGVFSAIVSYNHHPDGTANVGDPPIFSNAWWTIFLAVLDHARRHGMTLGIQDYCLLKPMLNAIGRDDPELRGAELRHVEGTATPGFACRLTWPSDATLLEATAWREGETIDLTGHAAGDALTWTPEAGEWQAAAVFALPTPFDPLHPQSGSRSLAAFQQMIGARVGDHLGTTLTMFFQDELDFGLRWPFWASSLPDAFLAAKGYPLTGRLAELFCAPGPASAALRLDFADVAVGMLERHYFEPVHCWHEDHGCLFGHDNAGRGAIAIGRDFYGDYMRTMRWYSAPGSDDPDLRGQRAFKGLKVASSIATLYERPRVWAECFHSSGWGATPAEMLDGVNGVFALGATLINLHGLYYTTAGSWWEWAPPDFHFRQPYWACMAVFNAYATRLSWLLSQGKPAAQVAILYPSTAIAGGLNTAVDPALAGPIPLSESQRGEPQPPVDAAEASAFAAARTLFDEAIGFDFIDDASLHDATIVDLQLAAGAGRWRTILLPEMTAIDRQSLCRLHAFASAGGRVVALGALPRVTGGSGIDDPDVATMLAEMFGVGGMSLHLAGTCNDFIDLVLPSQDRRVLVCGARVQVLQRSLDGGDIWFIRNPTAEAVDIRLSLRGQGAPLRLDPFTGRAAPIAGTSDGDGRCAVALTMAASSACVLLLDPTGVERETADEEPQRELLRLDSAWHFTLVPTMDNQFGDFACRDNWVGADIRRFTWCEGDMAGAEWRETAPGYAPRMRCLGPIPPGHDLADWEAAVASTPPGAMPPPLPLGDQVYAWCDYHFSTRNGILDDPWLRHWSSGPHGLKNAVPDDYIDLEGAPGDIWYLTMILGVAAPGPTTVVAGSRAAYRLWAGGDIVADQPDAMPPGRLPEWGLPHYRSDSRGAELTIDEAGTRLMLRLVQPDGQRLRAHVGLAGTPLPQGRRLRWFADAAMTLTPDAEAVGSPQWFSMQVPPGRTTITLCHRGSVSAWRDDEQMTVDTQAAPDGTCRSRIAASTLSDVPGRLLLRIDLPVGVRAGDCILEPIRLIAPAGPIAIGDWSEQGLAGYSGCVEYACDFTLSNYDSHQSPVLDIGPVGAIAEVVLNDRLVGCVLAPPWRIPIEGVVRPGTNRIVLRVFNTLANHYDAATPSGYVFAGQTRSGLLTAPRILMR